MSSKIKLKLSMFFAVSVIIVKAQVSVVNLQLMPYNVTPDGLLAVSIMNNGASQQVQLVSKLYNFNNELLMTVKSNSFNLKQGLNAPFDGSRKVSSSEYSKSQQAEHIKITHGLSSGTFKVCVNIIQISTSEIVDEFCDEIESNFNQYLYLVTPADKDTIETPTPLLLWAHSEPFNILSQGEYYRIVVTEMKEKQGAEEAVTINTPVMAKNYLTTHSFQYPYDAKELRTGKHYAWQVQKLANGVITNKTEAWEFVMREKPEEKEIKYVAMQQMIDASFYTAHNRKVYFKYIEEYGSQGNINPILKNDAGKEFPISINKDQKELSNVVNLKNVGDNRFILDLNGENLKPGFYVLQIKNEKKEMYYLKIYLPE